MNPRLPLAAALLVALSLGAQRADASTYLGSPDTTAEPDAFVCGPACPAGAEMGFTQFALRAGAVEAPEDGVLVAASVNAKRIGGLEPPGIAVLRPAEDADGDVTVVGSAPLPVSSPDAAPAEVGDLHLKVQAGDTIGFLFRAGEVDLGVSSRPRPDGAIQSFTLPCEPCGMDGGTGRELLLDALVEPDVDEDGLGDESQDPDGGGLGLDWEDQWFDDFEAGDELDDDFGEDAPRRVRRQLRLLEAHRLTGGHATLLLRVPRAGRISASVTLPANRRTGAGPFTTILTGEMRARHAGRVRLRLDPTVAGAHALRSRRRLRAKVVVAYFPRRSGLTLLMHSARF
jgi:hypothetical protein